MRETTKKYMGRFALALPTFKALCESAASLLGPAQPARTDREPLVAIITIRELATRLKVSETSVSREMLKLKLGGWISREVIDGKGCWTLGARRGATITLLADVQAEEATGSAGLVSKLVVDGLDDVLGAGSVPPVPSATPEVRRGGGRHWG